MYKDIDTAINAINALDAVLRNERVELCGKQIALLRDTIGMVELIILKRNASVQPRIKENLVEVAALFDELSTGTLEDRREMIGSVSATLQALSRAGFTQPIIDHPGFRIDP